MQDTDAPSNDPAETFDALQALIAESYPELRGQMRLIAEYLVDHADEIAFTTITEMADRIGVQPSSIVRFAKSFGHGGYSDLQKVFRSQLKSATRSYAQRIKNITGAATNSDKTSQILSDFVDQGIAALKGLRDGIAADRINKAVDLIINADNVYLLAERRAFPVAFYLSYALSNLEQRNVLLDGIGGLLKHQASLARPGDLIIAISFKSYSPSVVEIVEDRSSAGVQIVSITDSILSPIHSPADVPFDLPEPEAQEFRTLVAPMCLAQTLVVGVGHRLAERSLKGSD